LFYNRVTIVQQSTTVVQQTFKHRSTNF